MDIVLELFDTYGLDSLYATVLPAKSSVFASNATYPTLEAPSAYSQKVWEYAPASSYISFQPGQAAYMSQWPRDDWRRQFVSLYLITWFFGVLTYFLFASMSYVFIFDKGTFKHPKYLKNQMALEIKQTLKSIPMMSLLTAFCFLFEVRGLSHLYDATSEGPGMWYNFVQFPLFVLFTDCFIYLIHRGLHHPSIYKHLHKSHHKWIVPTPFASHAFHPLDGFAQSIPYHVFPFVFPLQKFAYVFLFMFINIWTIAIHDGEYVADNPIINGAACHTMHHLYFNYNYGQFTTLWDRLGGSYRKPNDELFRKELKMCKSLWAKQSEEMEKIAIEVEGEDDRDYVHEEATEPKKVR